jgi:hypothetical protein
MAVHSKQVGFAEPAARSKKIKGELQRGLVGTLILGWAFYLLSSWFRDLLSVCLLGSRIPELEFVKSGVVCDILENHFYRCITAQLLRRTADDVTHKTGTFI